MDADYGLVTIDSRFPADETVARLEAALAARAITLFAKIDHAAGAAAAGLVLGPATVLIFGNARAGTPLMQAEPRIGIDLPLKALVWSGADGAVRISYNEPTALARRHGLGPGMDATTGAMARLLAALAAEAAGQA